MKLKAREAAQPNLRLNAAEMNMFGLQPQMLLRALGDAEHFLPLDPTSRTPNLTLSLSVALPSQ